MSTEQKDLIEKLKKKRQVSEINHSLKKSKRFVSKPSYYTNKSIKSLNAKMSGKWGKDNTLKLEMNFLTNPKSEKSMFDIFTSEEKIYSTPKSIDCTFLGLTGEITAYEKPEDYLNEHGDLIANVNTKKDKDSFFFTLDLHCKYDEIDENMTTNTIDEIHTICFFVIFYEESETIVENWSGDTYAKNDFLKIIVTGKNELINETKELYLTRQ